MANTFAAFLIALKMVESGGDYQSVNTLNFIGAYQFGEAALTDLGYVRYDGDATNNDYSGGFTGKHGIRSVNDFLTNERVQDQAVEEWMRLMWTYIEMKNLDDYAWQRVGNIELSTSGMLAATHLLGTGGLEDFIRSGGSSSIRDPYGTPIAQYVVNLGGFDIPFGPNS